MLMKRVSRTTHDDKVKTFRADWTCAVFTLCTRNIDAVRLRWVYRRFRRWLVHGPPSLMSRNSRVSIRIRLWPARNDGPIRVSKCVQRQDSGCAAYPWVPPTSAEFDFTAATVSRSYYYYYYCCFIRPRSVIGVLRKRISVWTQCHPRLIDFGVIARLRVHVHWNCAINSKYYDNTNDKRPCVV